MPEKELDDVIRAVETWQTQRTEVFKRRAFNEGSNAKSLQEFVEIQNRLCKRLVSLTQKQDPDFWTAFMELATQCQVITTGAKTFVNGQDVSQLGM